jgi:D-amino-acid dehydrogenase
VVIAGGAWSSAFAAQLGVRLPIVPQRGQIIHLHLPDEETAAWPIITAFHGHYLVPWPDRRVVVGATRESGSGFSARTTAVGIHEVLGEALRVAPGLAGATIGEIRVGLRPATPDHLPLLGPVPTVRNTYIAAGHGATGLQLGPYSGKLLADLIGGRPADAEMAALAVSRFSMP